MLKAKRIFLTTNMELKLFLLKLSVMLVQVRITFQLTSQCSTLGYMAVLVVLCHDLQSWSITGVNCEPIGCQWAENAAFGESPSDQTAKTLLKRVAIDDI